MPIEQYDVAVVGGGILGLAHAWMAAERGLKVVLFERNAHAVGASVRNFGMIWPIGQPAGKQYEWAMQSRQFWLHLREAAGIRVRECGSIHLARHRDELAVLEEFVAGSRQFGGLEMLTADQVARKSSAVVQSGLLAGMWSSTELCVDPPTAIAKIRCWLETAMGVRTFFGQSIASVNGNELRTACDRVFQADRIVICGGSDFETLFPCHYQNAGLIKCKLQMLATAIQSGEWKLGPHLAGGLTLRHYRSFEHCPSLDALRQRIGLQSPELDRYGIHVMASQNDAGEVILGDSHVYGDEITPFDSAEIEDLILAELRKLISVPDFSIRRRWHGVYAKHPTKPVVVLEPQPQCRIVTAPGGAGMTLAFGLANQTWQSW